MKLSAYVGLRRSIPLTAAKINRISKPLIFFGRFIHSHLSVEQRAVVTTLKKSCEVAEINSK